jgi:hypothetical protein
MKIRRKAFSMLVIGVVVAATTVFAATPAQAAGAFSGLKNRGSNLCVEVNRFGNPLADGELVVQRACDGQLVQQWIQVFVDVNSGVFEFVNAFSGKCMDVRDGVNADTVPIQQWQCRGSNSMKWKLVAPALPSFNTWQVQSQTGGRCLDVRNGDGNDGVQIQIFHCTGFGNEAQVWTFIG